MAVAERAALDVLAGQRIGMPSARIVAKRQLLGRGPVNRTARSGLANAARRRSRAAFELPVKRESLGTGEQRLVDLAKPLERNARLRPVRRCPAEPASAAAARILLRLRATRYALLELLVNVPLDQRVGSSGGMVPCSTSVRAQLSRTVGCDADRLVHHRLRERRLVALVVPVTPIADQIDQEVAPKRARYSQRQARRLEARDRIVGIDVDDRES